MPGRHLKPTANAAKRLPEHSPRERHHHRSSHHKVHNRKSKGKHKHRKHHEDKGQVEEEDEMEEEDVAPITLDKLTKQLDDLHAWADNTMRTALERFDTKDYGYSINSLTRIIQKLKLILGLKSNHMALLESSPFTIKKRDEIVVPPEESSFPFVDDTAKLSYCFYKRAQCNYHLQKFQFASADVTVALGVCPTSPLLPQLFLLKGLALSSLQQFVDASKMFLEGLKHSPYDGDLKMHFHNSVKAMKQQYHVFSAPTNGSGGAGVGNPTALFDLGGSGFDETLEETLGGRGQIKNPEKGYKDRHANSLINRTSGFVRIHDLLEDEIKFWATYGVYLAKNDIKTDSYSVVNEFKEVLKEVFLHYAEGPDPIEELGAIRVDEKSKGRKSIHQKLAKRKSTKTNGGSTKNLGEGAEKKKERKHTLKGAAKQIMSELAKHGYVRDKSGNGTTANGLKVAELDKSEDQKDAQIASMIKESNEHEAFLPIFVKRSMTGSQFIAACLESGAITMEFGIDHALDALKHVARGIKAHENKLNQHHHHHHHAHLHKVESSGGREEGRGTHLSVEAMLRKVDTESEREISESSESSESSDSDSYSSFNSESQSDSEHEYDAEDLEEELGVEDKLEDFKLSGVTGLSQAYVFASEYTLLFPHFVECITRVILARYGPVVPNEVLERFKKDQEEWNNISNREGDDDNGDDGLGGIAGRGLRGRRRTKARIPGMDGLGGGGGPQPPGGRNRGGGPGDRKWSNVSTSSSNQRRPSHLSNNSAGMANAGMRFGSQQALGFLQQGNDTLKSIASLAVRLR